MAPRAVTPADLLREAGFVDVARAQSLIEELGITNAEAVAKAFAPVADPDLALLTAVRLREVGVNLEAMDSSLREKTLTVCGASAALGDHLVRHPESVNTLASTPTNTPLPTDAGIDGMRRAYRDRLLQIAAQDLTAEDPYAAEPDIAAALADLASDALEASLTLAQAEHPDAHLARIAVLGMGKTGGRELNYISDVDVLYVVAPNAGATVEQAITAATQVVNSLGQICSQPSIEPPLWEVDANLRPEGKDGPVVRTLDSYLEYYQQWAQNWEFQALLKARPVAGDKDLGNEFTSAVEPLIYAAVERDGFVTDAQAMRRRVVAHLSPNEADRELKLGRGGLRDVEFTVQLLQLVHGRTDPLLRVRSTLNGIWALAQAGYLARDYATRLDEHYRFLRVLEHRIQLHRLRRTHLLPTSEPDLRRLARGLGLTRDELLKRLADTRQDVIRLHESVFYRPLLPEYAQLSAADISLTSQAAETRLRAAGFRDPQGAMRHIEALTSGHTRTEALQRQLLPVMLGWFAEAGDPDAGLLAYRRISEKLGGASWYMKLLRDSGSAAHRLANLLAESTYLADGIASSPEAVRWLADNADLSPRNTEQLVREAASILDRADSVEQAATSLRRMRKRELARIGSGELLGLVDPTAAARGISDVADATLAGALSLAAQATSGAPGDGHLLVVAMGRFGGQEMGYASDADVMFVASDEGNIQVLTARAQQLRSFLGGPGLEPPLAVDIDLRPEGKAGPLVRTLSAFREYYARWSNPWEAQALLRARPIVAPGSLSCCHALQLSDEFLTLINPVRYPAGGLTPAGLREVRSLKARMEAHRLPRGVTPERHLKLGPGGLSDVEWTAQLLQLNHAAEIKGLQTTSTVQALDAIGAANLLPQADVDTLLEAWHLASTLRAANVLLTGRTSGTTLDVLPHDRKALAGLADLVPGVESGPELEERYLRTARRARAVMERAFYQD